MSSRIREIRRVAGKGFWVTVASALLALSQWIIMVVIARIDGTDQLGVYALAQAWINPALFLSWLGIRQQLIMSPSKNVGNLFSLRLSVPIIAYVAVCLILASISPTAGVLMIAIVFALGKYVEGLFDFEYSILQGTQKDWIVALSSALRAFTVTALFVAVYYLTRTLVIALIVNAVCSLALFFPLHWRSLRSQLAAAAQTERLDARLQYGLLISLAPLGLGAFVGQLTTSVPRMIIETRIGVEALGHFSAVMALVMIGAIAAASIGQAVLPSLAQAFEERNGRQFLAYALLPFMFVMAGCLLGFVILLHIGGYLLVLIYGPTFSEGGNLLAIGALVAGPSYSATLANGWVIALRAYRVSFLVQIAALTVTSILTAQLAAIAGSAGALVAFGVAGIVQIILSTGYVLLRWRGKTNFA